jgi:hypothetical protein
MRNFQISPRGLLYFLVFLVLFAGAMAVDGGSGYLSRMWVVLVWSLLLLGSVLLYARLWTSRHDPDAGRRIQARGLFGLLPQRLRDWIFS